MVPVICHQEPLEEGVQFFASYDKHPAVSQLVHAHVSKTIYKAFDLGAATISHKLVTVVLNGGLAIKLGGDYVGQKSALKRGDWMMSGAFMIENGKITASQPYGFDGVPDCAKLVMDMMGSTEAIVACASECSRDLSPFVPKLDQKLLKQYAVPPKKKSAVSSISCFAVPDEPESSSTTNEGITLDQVLANTKALMAFRLHMNKEHSPESLLFLDQTDKYVKIQAQEAKQNKAQEIIDAFFDPNAMLGLNINTTVRKKVITRLQEQGPVNDLFVAIRDELKLTVLSDSFARFKITVEYEKLKW